MSISFPAPPSDLLLLSLSLRSVIKHGFRNIEVATLGFITRLQSYKRSALCQHTTRVLIPKNKNLISHKLVHHVLENVLKWFLFFAQNSRRCDGMEFEILNQICDKNPLLAQINDTAPVAIATTYPRGNQSHSRIKKLRTILTTQRSGRSAKKS